MPLSSYRDLIVWQQSMELLREVYALTRSLPKSEIFGLTGQLRRAVVSVGANIAEGYGREHRGEYLHHLSIANGSLKELETLLIGATYADLLSCEAIEPALLRAATVGRLLTALRRRLRERASS